MFNYYDNRMKWRLYSLNRNSSKNTHMINRIVDLSKFCLEYIQWEEAIQRIKKEVFVQKKTSSKRSSLKMDLAEHFAKNSTLGIPVGMETDD